MKAHRTDGVSLGFAVVFLGIVALWLVTHILGIEAPKAGWLVAGALILFGVLGLLGTLRAGRKPAENLPAGSMPADPDENLPKAS